MWSYQYVRQQEAIHYPIPCSVQMVEEMQGSLPTQFLQQVLAPDSAFVMLRSSCGTAVRDLFFPFTHINLLLVVSLPLSASRLLKP